MDIAERKKRRKNLLKTLGLLAGLTALLSAVNPFFKVLTRSTVTVGDSFFMNNKFGLIHFKADWTGSFSPMNDAYVYYDFTWEEKQGFIETRHGGIVTDWSRYENNKIFDVDSSVIYIHVISEVA